VAQPPVWRRLQRARSRFLRAGAELRPRRAARPPSPPFWHSHRRWMQSMAQAHSPASPLVAHARASLPVAHARWRRPCAALRSGSSTRNCLPRRLRAARRQPRLPVPRPQPAPQPREPRLPLRVTQWVVRHRRNLLRVREQGTRWRSPAFSSVVRAIPGSIPLPCRKGFEYALVHGTVAGTIRIFKSSSARALGRFDHRLHCGTIPLAEKQRPASCGPLLVAGRSRAQCGPMLPGTAGLPWSCGFDVAMAATPSAADVK